MTTKVIPLIEVIEQRNNYLSHLFDTVKQFVPGEPDEYVTSCVHCGVEDRGDPAEFNDLNYPHCDDIGDE